MISVRFRAEGGGSAVATATSSGTTSTTNGVRVEG